MSRIEELADRLGEHLQIPWQRTIAGAQRVIMVVYDKEQERLLRARKVAFEAACQQAGHDWHEVDLTTSFSAWMSGDEYREEYFASPEDLDLKLENELPGHIAEQIRETLRSPGVTDHSVVAVFGVASLFGLTRISQVLKLVERDIQGRLVIFFPGHLDRNNYRLLDARDGWNYLAVPITQHGEGAVP